MEGTSQENQRKMKFEKNKKGNIRNPYGALMKLINEILKREN
jgi:hypothetical protein